MHAKTRLCTIRVCVYAREGYADRARGESMNRYETSSAEMVLEKRLGDKKWHSDDEIRELIKRHGVSKKAFKQARINLRIMTRNNGDGTWDWRLP